MCKDKICDKSKMDDIFGALQQKQMNKTPYEKQQMIKSKIENWANESFVPEISDGYVLEQKKLKYPDLLDQYERKGHQFFDHDFPTNSKSIIGFGEDPSLPNHVVNKMKWERPANFFNGEKFQIFDHDISPNDIQQGYLGDCYLLSAIAAIAEHPYRIKQLFLVREVNKPGIYSVALFIYGNWEEVILDDQFPCQANGEIAFNKTKTNELWVMLLEKAYAKVHGGYGNISAGLTKEALRDLTGAPAHSISTRVTAKVTLDSHWENILQGEENDFIMSASSMDLIGNGSDAQDQRTGLAGSHAYALLAAFELINDRGSIRLR